jgi:hypothetical protein
MRFIVPHTFLGLNVNNWDTHLEKETTRDPLLSLSGSRKHPGTKD